MVYGAGLAVCDSCGAQQVIAMIRVHQAGGREGAAFPLGFPKGWQTSQLQPGKLTCAECASRVASDDALATESDVKPPEAN